MNQDQINWILEAEKNNALNPEQQQWLAQAREAGAIGNVTQDTRSVSFNINDEFNSLVSGLGDLASALPKGNALREYQQNFKVLKAFDDIDNGIDPSVETVGFGTDINYLKFVNEYKQASPEQRQAYKQQMTNQFLEGIPENAGASIDQWVAETFPVSEEGQQEWRNKLLRGGGQYIGMIAQSLLLRRAGGAGVALSGAQGSAMNGYDQFMAAIQNPKASIEDAFKASDWAKAAGATDMIPLLGWLSKLDKAGGGKIKAALISGLEEGSQEALVEVLNNIISNSVYDSGDNLFKGTTEAGSIGFTLGSFTQFFGQLLAGRKAKTAAQATQSDDKAVASKAADYFGGSTEQPLVSGSKLPSERTGLSGTVQNTYDAISTVFGRKAVSVLDKYTDSPTAMALRNDIEHFEKFEGPEGMVKGPDWYETKQTNMGDLYAPVENALERVRDSWGGRKMSSGLQERLLNAINGTTKIKLNKSQMEAYNQLKAGNEGPAKALSNKERRDVDLAYAANTIKNSVAETDVRLEAAGVVKGYERQGNIPFFFNRKTVRRNMGAFANWLTSKGYADDQAHGQRIAQSILANGGVAFQNDPDLKDGNANINKPINPKEVPKQFVETDIETALPKYTLRAANRIAYANVFGADGGGVNKLLKQIQDELAANGRNLERGDAEQIRDLSDAMLNRYNPVFNEAVSTVNRGLVSFETLSTLGGATLSSAQEPFIMIERMGLGPFVRSLPQATNTLAREMVRLVNKKLVDPSGSTRVARDLGVALEAANAEVLSSTFTGDFSGIQDAFFKSPFGMFLHQWTTFNRIWATNVGMKVLDNWSDQAARGKFKESQYKDLGLTKDDMQAIALLKQQTGMTLEQILTVNANNPNPQTEAVLNAVLPSGRTLRDTVRPALVRMVNESVIAPRATNRPMWMNDPHLSTVSMLKSFPIVFGNTVAKRMVKKIDPRNLRRMTPCEFKNLFVAGAALLGAAYAMVAVKDAMKGKDVTERPLFEGTPKEIGQSRLGQAIQTTGILGPFQLLADVFQYNPEGVLGPVWPEAGNMISNLSKFFEEDIGLNDLAGMIGERTARIFGSIGKSEDLQKALGDYLYNLAD